MEYLVGIMDKSLNFHKVIDPQVILQLHSCYHSRYIIVGHIVDKVVRSQLPPNYTRTVATPRQQRIREVA